jgi:hypothetical protein
LAATSKLDEQKPSSARTLRACARVALERRGFVVRKKPGLGVVPGARLRIQRPGQAEQTVVVRVSKKRKIGISRHQWSGRWFEVPGLNEVVIVSPSLHDPRLADVIGFDAGVLIQVFEVLDTLRNGPYTENRELNFPILVALDPRPGDESNSSSSNLIEKASWVAEVSLPEPASTSIDHVVDGREPARAVASSEPKVKPEGFIERVRREFAEINGVDVGKVMVNFHIVG